MTTAYVAMGSNLGDRARSLFDGVRLLLDRVPCRARLSPLYETDPVDYLDQPKFLNGVLELAGDLPAPAGLLELCLAVEARLGRERSIAKGPRTIDLDLLFWGNAIVDTPDLVLPHPRLHERRFALEPLADLAPDLVHPLLGATVREMLDRLAAEEREAGVYNPRP